MAAIRLDGTPSSSSSTGGLPGLLLTETAHQRGPWLPHAHPPPRGIHETTIKARFEQGARTCRAEYALRAGTEGTVSQALDITGIRQARFRSLPKVLLQHVFSATAINIIQLDTHWTDQPLHRVRTSRLERLAYQLTS
ncbi:transposase [Streptomyces sp. x-19]|uniref:transposase n=1 Tax=Streptomyces sp. x-19 TaxID=2789280 RepID=UPI00397EC39C